MARTTYKVKITDEEVISQISKENQKLIKLFLKEKGRKCSEATMKVYASDLNIFFCWNVLENDNKFYPNIKKVEISSFFDYLLNTMKVNGKRFAHFKSILSGLSDCVIKFYDEDYPTFRNFISAVVENIPKPDVREKTILEEEDVDYLLSVLNEQERYQEACLVALAAYSGMRISELEQMKVSFFSEDSLGYEGLFYKTTEKLRTKGHGKEGKVINRYILHDLFKPYFDKWTEERKKILDNKEVEDHDSLFINRQGLPATQEVIRGFCEKWEKILNKPIYAHCFRHYFTTLMKSKYKCSDEFVKSVVQWSDISLVSLYNDTKDEDVEWAEIDTIKNILNK